MSLNSIKYRVPYISYFVGELVWVLVHSDDHSLVANHHAVQSCRTKSYVIKPWNIYVGPVANDWNRHCFLALQWRNFCDVRCQWSADFPKILPQWKSKGVKWQSLTWDLFESVSRLFFLHDDVELQWFCWIVGVELSDILRNMTFDYLTFDMFGIFGNLIWTSLDFDSNLKNKNSSMKFLITVPSCKLKNGVLYGWGRTDRGSEVCGVCYRHHFDCSKWLGNGTETHLLPGKETAKLRRQLATTLAVLSSGFDVIWMPFCFVTIEFVNPYIVLYQ